MVRALGFVLDSDTAREEVIDLVLDPVPPRPEGGHRDLRELLATVTDYPAGLGVIGANGLRSLPAM